MKKILFVITEFSFFKSHYFERAAAAAESGYEVYVATKMTNKEYRNEINDNIKYINVNFNRSGVNPYSEFLTIISLWLIMRKVAPHIIHNVALKPILYGSIAAKLICKDCYVVNAPVGMGYIFTSERFGAKILRPVVSNLLKYAFKGNFVKVIFENKDDLSEFSIKGKIKKTNCILIRGAGVDIDKFYPIKKNINHNNHMPSVTLVARMLIEKGVIEFISAAKIVNSAGVIVNFNLVGDPDTSNPSSIERSYLESMSGHNGLNWYGYTEDVFKIYSKTDIACLPSYREGLPKSLLEAAACGLPIITTDAIGCREVVIDGLNGLLIPVKSAESIASAIVYLVNEPELRLKMGLMSREIAVNHFSNNIVIRETLDLYNELIFKI